MTRPPLADDIIAVIPDASGASWSRLPGLGGGAWLIHRVCEPALVVRAASDREVLAAQAAAAVQVGPSVVASAGGWLAVEFLSGTGVTTLEVSRPMTLVQLAQLLHRWHAVSLQLPEAPMASARSAYLAEVDQTMLPNGLLRAAELADTVELELESTAGRRVPGHLDVVANLMRTPAGLRLIDFEYTATTTPARELGQVAWEAELDRRGASRLVAAYGAGDEVTDAAVAAWAWVTGVTWTIWAARRTGDPHMQRYARRSWERLKVHWARPDA